ncbi:MAG: hypothetical protein AAFX39_04675 [Pseudomonadota bacterium]
MKKLFANAFRAVAASLKSPICQRLCAIVFVIVLVTDLTIAGVMFLHERAAFERTLHDRAVSYVRSSVDITTFPDIDKLVKFGENLVASTEISGGIYINSIGEEAGQFGARPWLTWQAAQMQALPWRLSDYGLAFDTFIKPAETGLSYGLLLRLDSSAAWSQLLIHTSLKALTAFVSAALIAMFSMAVMTLLVLRPARKMSRAIDHALRTPEKAIQSLARLHSSDELGVLGRNIDQLLFLVGTTYVEDLATAAAINEQVPAAILTFSEDGHLMSANSAALRLFQVETLEDLGLQQYSGFVSVQGKARIASELIQRGRFFGPADAIVAADMIPCLIGGDRVLRTDGSIARYFLMLMDVRNFVADMRTERAKRRNAEETVALARRTIDEMQDKTDAYALLFEIDQTKSAAAKPMTLRPDALVSSWLVDAAKAGKILSARATHERLPPVKTSFKDTERIFELALSVVAARSGETTPLLDVTGGLHGQSEAAFRVREQSPTANVGKTAPQGRTADVDVQVAAINRLANRTGGRLMQSLSGKGEPNEISFTLPADHALIRRTGVIYRNDIFGKAA